MCASRSHAVEAGPAPALSLSTMLMSNAVTVTTVMSDSQHGYMHVSWSCLELRYSRWASHLSTAHTCMHYTIAAVPQEAPHCCPKHVCILVYQTDPCCTCLAPCSVIKMHHGVLRGLLAKHQGYESQTEGVRQRPLMWDPCGAVLCS